LSYRIFGAEVSPYSVKVRSYFRYKGLPHEWILRTPEVQEEYKKYAKLPLIPLVVTPEGEGIQDSTPIIERVEAAHPEPSIHPDDPALAFLSALLEEFADEWANKWMFHYRWWREVDQISKDQIEASFESGMTQLERHLAERPFLFGGRPAFADFGLWGQVYNASTDPTCGGLLAGHAAIHAWIERMHDPKAEGGFESWNSLEATLRPLLAEQVGALFLPWSDANARALAAGQESFEVTLAGRRWEQKPQKYHARSLAALRKRYAAVTDRSALDPILESTGCLAWLSE
jgi:glutathione S-transferase